jgi:hypothetical protein
LGLGEFWPEDEGVELGIIETLGSEDLFERALHGVVLTHADLDTPVPERGREIGNLQGRLVDHEENSEVGMGLDCADLVVDEATLVDADLSVVFLQQPVESVEDGRVAEVAVLENHPVAIHDRLHKDRVSPVEGTSLKFTILLVNLILVLSLLIKRSQDV